MSNLTSSLADNEELQKLRTLVKRTDGREDSDARKIRITPDYTMHAEGSVLIEVGQTRVICTASVEDTLPPFLRGKNQGGWLTAEYGMLPRSTGQRMNRESSQGRVGGRTHEIQRLIGRSLRSILNLKYLGDRTIKIDCDVIQADGGTRTASITGAYVALVLALRKVMGKKSIRKNILLGQVAAISMGVVHERTMLDLKYDEDSSAEVDMNVVMLNDRTLIEVQGTAEQKSFTRQQMNEMLDYAEKGLDQCFEAQMEALGGYLLQPNR